MSESLTIDSISQAHQLLGLSSPKHPLVAVVYNRDVKSMTNFQDVRITNRLFQVSYKSSKQCGEMLYGKNSYDYQEGTLVFTSPGQVLEFRGELDLAEENKEGWVLAFHPDLIRKSHLGTRIDQYSFFDYDVHEALHLSEDELNIIQDLLKKIEFEYSQNLDRHSQNLIVSNIELLLDYCLRFYDRQFITRTNLNSDIVSKFERHLKHYYEGENALEQGIPTVAHCGEALNLSPNYLSDLLKKETGKTAQEHIHLFIIDKAKSSLLNSSESISAIGYSLGFEYPQHFSNLFKSKTGYSPKEYRHLN